MYVMADEFDHWLEQHSLAHIKSTLAQASPCLRTMNDVRQRKGDASSWTQIKAFRLAVELGITEDADIERFQAAMQAISEEPDELTSPAANDEEHLSMWDGDDIKQRMELRNYTADAIIADQKRREELPTPAKDVLAYTRELHKTLKGRPDGGIKLKAALRATYGFDEKAIRLLQLLEKAGVELEVRGEDEDGCPMIAVFMNKGAPWNSPVHLPSASQAKRESTACHWQYICSSFTSE